MIFHTRLTTMSCMSKAFRFLIIKTSPQNISIMLLQIHEHRGGYWRKKFPWSILDASKMGSGVISLLWQLRCHCNPVHNKFSYLSNTIDVAIFPNLCLLQRSLRSNLGGIDPEKLYRATLELRYSRVELKVPGSSFFPVFCVVVFYKYIPK